MRGVVFDVDGTLVDSNWLHALAWTRALRELGENPPMHRVHRLVGMGADRFVTELLGHDVDGASDGYSRHFEPLKAEMRAFPGASDLLREIKRRGAAVVLATSAKQEDIAALRSAIAADDAIDQVTSSGDVEESKPAPDIFAVALRMAGLDPADAIAVGDTAWDVEAAQRAGLACVGVATGGWTAADLRAAGSVAVYEDVAELLAQFGTSPLGALLS